MIEAASAAAVASAALANMRLRWQTLRRVRIGPVAHSGGGEQPAARSELEPCILVRADIDAADRGEFGL